MGYIRHNAIVVTSWNSDSIQAAAEKAKEIGMQVLGPSYQVVNGYSSILICPDGSKEGWDSSDEGDSKRSAFRAWLETQAYDDGSSSLEWAEVVFGSDDKDASIVTHAWSNPLP